MNQQALQEQKLASAERIAGLKSEGTVNKNNEENHKQVKTLTNALDTIGKMRSLGKKGNLGRGSSIKGFFGGEAAKDAAEYERYGKSLIQLSTSIPIRNQAEFNTLAEDLFDASLPDSYREGVLNAMEDILRKSLSVYDEEGTEEMMRSMNVKKNRPPLSSFGKK
jgi:hypothetical protein